MDKIPCFWWPNVCQFYYSTLIIVITLQMTQNSSAHNRNPFFVLASSKCSEFFFCNFFRILTSYFIFSLQNRIEVYTAQALLYVSHPIHHIQLYMWRKTFSKRGKGKFVIFVLASNRLTGRIKICISYHEKDVLEFYRKQTQPSLY
jgi:hypothetical protein